LAFASINLVEKDAPLREKLRSYMTRSEARYREVAIQRRPFNQVERILPLVKQGISKTSFNLVAITFASLGREVGRPSAILLTREKGGRFRG
jgi:hypothetical protein